MSAVEQAHAAAEAALVAADRGWLLPRAGSIASCVYVIDLVAGDGDEKNPAIGRDATDRAALAALGRLLVALAEQP